MGLSVPSSFDDFLRTVVTRHHPEALMLLGPADVSAESPAAPPHPQSWAYRCFPAAVITDHREFDRAALALRALHHVLVDDARSFPWPEPLRKRLISWTRAQTSNAEELTAMAYAVMFNDLGKLLTVAQRYTTVTGQMPLDHDAMLGWAFRHATTLFPTFNTLNARHREALMQGLDSNFNVGSAVQQECADVAWNAFRALPPNVARFHGAHSLFDYLGSSGAHDPIAWNDAVVDPAAVEAFLSVITLPDPVTYRQARLNQTHLPEGSIALARLVGLSRSFTVEAMSPWLRAWKSLDPVACSVLDREWTIGACSPALAYERPIDLHYAPAMLANARVRSIDQKPHDGDDQARCQRALSVLAELWSQARTRWNQNSFPNPTCERIIINVLDVARRIGDPGFSLDHVRWVWQNAGCRLTLL